MHGAIHKFDELLCVPQGWLLCENTLPGQHTHHGIRKSFFTRHKGSLAECESSLALFKASARDVTRMRAIADTVKFES